MNYIQQKDSRGCGVAALAMVLGMSYEATAADFTKDPWERGTRDLNQQGLYQTEVDRYLWKHNQFVLRKYIFSGPDWPPLPFAERHICNVKVSAESPINHFVAMDGSGKVFDPLDESKSSLMQYHSVENVSGLSTVTLQQGKGA